MSEQEETTLSSTKRNNPLVTKNNINATERLIDKIMRASAEKAKRHRQISRKRFKRIEREAKVLQKISNKLNKENNLTLIETFTPTMSKSSRDMSYSMYYALTTTKSPKKKKVGK